MTPLFACYGLFSVAAQTCQECRVGVARSSNNDEAAKACMFCAMRLRIVLHGLAVVTLLQSMFLSCIGVPPPGTVWCHCIYRRQGPGLHLTFCGAVAFVLRL